MATVANDGRDDGANGETAAVKISSSSSNNSNSNNKDSTIHVEGFHKWVRVICMIAIGAMLAFGLFNEVSRSQTQTRENITHAPDMHQLHDQPWNRGGVGGGSDRGGGGNNIIGLSGTTKIEELIEKPRSPSSSATKDVSNKKQQPEAPAKTTEVPTGGVRDETTEQQQQQQQKDQVVLSGSKGRGDPTGGATRGERPTPTFANGRFPLEEAQSVSSSADVVDKGIYTPEKYTCIREEEEGEEEGNKKTSTSSTGSSTGYRYQHVFLPIGCWGNQLKVGACSNSSPSKKNNLSTTTPARGPKPEDLEICRLGERLAQVTSCGHNKFASFLGDNFYPWGIEKRSPRLEVESTEKFWRHPSLRMPYYVTAGNHDNQGKSSIKPQFRFNHSYWKFPAIHHTSPMMTGPDGKTSVQLFLFSTHWGGKKINPYMETEAEWLDQQLSASTARWKIVITHEPIWGFMGFPHQEMMVKFIHPVLVKHTIRLLVVAHQHSVSIHQNKGGYYQLTSAGFYPAHIHDFAKPNRPVGRFHLGMGATMVLIDYDRLDIVGFDKTFNLIWDASVPFDDDGSRPAAAEAGEEGKSSRSSSSIYGNPDWVPANSATYKPDNGGPKDYWIHLPQCEAQMPKLCRR